MRHLSKVSFWVNCRAGTQLSKRPPFRKLGWLVTPRPARTDLLVHARDVRLLVHLGFSRIVALEKRRRLSLWIGCEADEQ
jgi:hypothetical protein